MSRFIYQSVYSKSMKSKLGRQSLDELRAPLHWRLVHTSFDCRSDLS